MYVLMFCMQTLKRKEKEYEHEMEKLAREKIATQQRLAELKNDLSQCMDVMEIERLLRQTVQPEDDQASTSTASGTASLLIQTSIITQCLILSVSGETCSVSSIRLFKPDCVEMFLQFRHFVCSSMNEQLDAFVFICY